MKAIVLQRNGKAEEAFAMEERPVPEPGTDEVLIKVEAFGLNFADVMSRLGMYRDAPPIPFIPGYEVVGRVEKTGQDVQEDLTGQRVVAFTRFGGYAEYATTKKEAVAPIGEDMDAGQATALATQYCTAWFSAMEATNIRKGDRVLIHAAAGGVGTALVQLAKHQGAEVFGTAGSGEKLQYLKELGVDHPVNYRTQDYETVVREKLSGQRLDLAFNSIGGKTFKKDMRLLGAGGRIVCYGGAERTGKRKGLFNTLKFVWDFGLLHPIGLLMNAKGVIGVNMLRLADHAPHKVAHSLEGVVELTREGVLDPHVGGRFSADRIAEAHRLLEERKSRGKLVVMWGE